MNCKILSVRAKEGKQPLVLIEILCDDEKKKYTVNEGTYREIGCPLSGEMIDEDALYAISYEDERYRAMKKALRLLEYADNNVRGLMRKLCVAGFSREVAKDTAMECVRLGYIDERRQLERLIVRCAEELLGPRRILAKVESKGYSVSLGAKILYSLIESEDINLNENKKKLLEKKLPEGAGNEEKRKLLYKYGY